MKNIVLLQILIYLYISPLLLAYIGDYSFPLSISFVFFVGFLLGVFTARYVKLSSKSIYYIRPPIFSFSFKLFLIIYSIIYALIVVDQGLVYRRLGSEHAAQLAANMPIYYKILMRVYEVTFYPLLFVLLTSFAHGKRNTTDFFLLVAFVFAFLFTGAFDSRMKLIFPVIFYYVFLCAPKPVYKPVPKFYFIAIGGVLSLAVFYVGFSRVQAFNGASEYLINDVVLRLNGLNLINRIDDLIDIPFYGTFDVQMWGNVIAIFPFSEEARALKAQGLTSSKSYFLQIILKTDEFDSVNSLTTDLFYFGGYSFTLIGSFLYGFLVRRFDSYVKENRIFKNRSSLAFSVLSSSMDGSLRMDILLFFLILYGIS